MRKSITSITGLMILLVISLPITFATELNLTYDANGNLISGDGKYRQYNSLNQLVTIYNGTNSSGLLLETYQYHPTEERILVKKVYNATGGLRETTIYSSKSLVRTINSSGTYDTTYVYQNSQLVAQRLSDGTKQYIHTDHLGSATVVTSELGQQIENMSYAPFGGVISGGSTTRYDYEAKESDSLVGDTDFHFRKYLSQYGMFAQPDTLIQNVYDPQTLNRYAFERNNPYKYKDEDGHIIPLIVGAILILFFTSIIVINILHYSEGGAIVGRGGDDYTGTSAPPGYPTYNIKPRPGETLPYEYNCPENTFNEWCMNVGDVGEWFDETQSETDKIKEYAEQANVESPNYIPPEGSHMTGKQASSTQLSAIDRLKEYIAKLTRTLQKNNLGEKERVLTEKNLEKAKKVLETNLKKYPPIEEDAS